MGGLHIEMAMLKLIGDWLDVSGWTYVMTSANVTSDGVIKLQQQLCSFSFTGHADYQLNTPDNEQRHYDEWCKQIAAEHLQFDYWFKV